MLVLSRKRGEVIRVGGEIEVTVVEIRGGKVRLGITAPKDVSIHRVECVDQCGAADAAPGDSNSFDKTVS